MCEPLLYSEDTPINPFRVTREFTELVDPAQTIVLHDAGTVRGTTSQHYVATQPRSFLGFGVQSAMGWSIGAAMGAKKAHPDKLVTAFIGEEAFNETAMDIETSIRNDAPILIIVKNNRKMPDTDGGKSKKLAVARFKQGVDIGALATALGAKAYRVEKPGEISQDLVRPRSPTCAAASTAVVEILTVAHQRQPASPLGRERQEGQGRSAGLAVLAGCSAVVPAQAGTHNHRKKKVCDQRAPSHGHGAWVPACAGRQRRLLRERAISSRREFAADHDIAHQRRARRNGCPRCASCRAGSPRRPGAAARRCLPARGGARLRAGWRSRPKGVRCMPSWRAPSRRWVPPVELAASSCAFCCAEAISTRLAGEWVMRQCAPVSGGECRNGRPAAPASALPASPIGMSSNVHSS